eukprot:SAG31_NODE_1031_length_10234_cov_6.100049_8_plen_42_part_00
MLIAGVPSTTEPILRRNVRWDGPLSLTDSGQDRRSELVYII